MASALKLEFVMSAPRLADLPPTAAEVALAGRSNVGKSSLLNALASARKLATVSSKPGSTKLLNFFVTPQGTSLVDLPGYGYASTASARMREAWLRRTERYLLQREGLRLVLLLVDGEIGPTSLDQEVIAWLRDHGVPFQIVATKHDKVKASKRDRRKRDLPAACGVAPSEVIWVSAERNVGIDRLRELVRETLSA
ncbi:MAG TPA: ribosome biogenesis GTP-binding protein YihA/YsxC [Egibacteraceae bacterium]|nr:ribosome biogenesis GTP-binding protein YihA/YsxC [Egibacteraceae bacterium]